MSLDGAGAILAFSDEALRAADIVSLAGSACHGAFDRIIVKASTAMRYIIKGETLPHGSAGELIAEIRREERSFGHEMRDVARFNFCKVLAGVIDMHEQPADAAQIVKDEPMTDEAPDPPSCELPPPQVAARDRREDAARETSGCKQDVVAQPHVHLPVVNEAMRVNMPDQSLTHAGQPIFSNDPATNNHRTPPQLSPPQVAAQDRHLNEDAAGDTPHNQTSADTPAKLKLFDCTQPECGLVSTSFQGTFQHAEDVVQRHAVRMNIPDESFTQTGKPSFSNDPATNNCSTPPQLSPPQVAERDRRMNEDAAGESDAPAQLKLSDCTQPECGFVSTPFEGTWQHAENVVALRYVDLPVVNEAVRVNMPEHPEEEHSHRISAEPSTLENHQYERKPLHILFRNPPLRLRTPMKSEPSNDVQNDEAGQRSFNSDHVCENYGPPPQLSPPQVASRDRRMEEDAAGETPQTSVAAAAKLKIFDCTQPGCGFASTSFEGLCQHAESAHPFSEDLMLQYLSERPKKYARRTKKAATQPSPCSAAFTGPASNTRRSTQKPMTPEGKYSCSFPGCDKTFVYSNDIYRHIRCFHMKERKYHCPVCEMRFTRRFSRNSHFKKFHRGEEQ